MRTHRLPLNRPLNACPAIRNLPSRFFLVRLKQSREGSPTGWCSGSGSAAAGGGESGSSRGYNRTHFGSSTSLLAAGDKLAAESGGADGFAGVFVFLLLQIRTYVAPCNPLSRCGGGKAYLRLWPMEAGLFWTVVSFGGM